MKSRSWVGTMLFFALLAGKVGAAPFAVADPATRYHLARIIDKTGLAPAISSGNRFAALSPLAANTAGTCTANLSAVGNGRKLWAIYMVGADLEGKHSYATANLKQLISGWQQLAAPSDIDIVVAFGGANKDGWRGIKYASIAQLVADSADEVFGNGSDYLYRDDTADMGQQAVFEAFLNHVNGNYAQHSRRFLSFWNHGSTYNAEPGIGPDENTNNVLDITKINNGLANSGSCYHLIGFDACLMASLETAVAIKDFARYMIASEELEPGHGWNYAHVLNALAAQPGNAEVGKAMVDSFVDSASHAYVADGKTLSVLDLAKVDAVLKALEPAASSLTAGLSGGDGQAVIRAFYNAQQYAGKLTVDPSVVPSQLAIDLKDFLGIVALRSQNGTLKQQIATVSAAIDDLVAYSRDDGSRPRSTGVSIAPLDMATANATRQIQLGLLSSAWGDLIGAYRALQAKASAPTVSGLQSGISGAGLSYISARDGMVDGATATAMSREQGIVARFDSPYLADVRGAFGLVDKDGGLIMLGENPAYPTSDDRYFFPQWNGQGMALVSARETLFLPVFMTQVANKGISFNAIVVIERAGLSEPLLGMMSIGPGDDGAFDSSISVILHRGERFLLSRAQETIKANDTVSLFAIKQMPDGASDVVALTRHTFAEAPVVRQVPYTNGTFGYTLAGYSLSEEGSIAAIQPVSGADRVFNWGAATHPSLNLESDSQLLGGYYARCNQARSLCLGTQGDNLWFYDGKLLGSLGATDGWLQQAQSAGY